MFGDYKDILTIVVLLISLGGTLYAFLTRPAKHANDEVEALRKRVDGHGNRLQRVEDTMEHLPDMRTAHNLEISVEQLNGRIATLNERLKPIEAISERMQELMLRSGDK